MAPRYVLHDGSGEALSNREENRGGIVEVREDTETRTRTMRMGLYYEKQRHFTPSKHDRLLQNAPPHTSRIITILLKSKKNTVLQHPPVSPDMVPFDFHPFPN